MTKSVVVLMYVVQAIPRACRTNTPDIVPEAAFWRTPPSPPFASPWRAGSIRPSSDTFALAYASLLAPHLDFQMPRVAVTLAYFDFFPELKAELAAMYPDTKFRSDRKPLSEEELIEYCKGYDTAVIGLDRFTDRVCAALPELKVISLCSAGVDHIDPAVLKKHGKKMWWAAGINKVSVSELAVCYMVLAVRRVHFFSSVLRKGEWKGPIGMGADLRGRTVGIHGCGFIGKEVVKLLQPYGVNILACDRVDYLRLLQGMGRREGGRRRVVGALGCAYHPSVAQHDHDRHVRRQGARQDEARLIPDQLRARQHRRRARAQGAPRERAHCRRGVRRAPCRAGQRQSAARRADVLRLAAHRRDHARVCGARCCARACAASKTPTSRSRASTRSTEPPVTTRARRRLRELID